jgi:hypothetical protein
MAIFSVQLLVKSKDPKSKSYPELLLLFRACKDDFYKWYSRAINVHSVYNSVPALIIACFHSFQCSFRRNNARSVALLLLAVDNELTHTYLGEINR